MGIPLYRTPTYVDVDVDVDVDAPERRATLSSMHTLQAFSKETNEKLARPG